MKRIPTPAFMLLLIVSIFLLFGSCQKDSDLFAEAVLDDFDDSGLDNPSQNNGPEPELTTISIDPTDDAFLQDGNGYNEKIVRVETERRTTYLKYDLTPITGAITHAYLEFTTDNDSGNGRLEALKGVDTNWNEENLNVENAPEMGKVLGEINGVYETGSRQRIVLDAKKLSSTMISIILNKVSGNDISIASKENNSNPGPQLIVEYDADASGNNSQQEAENDETELTNDNVIRLNSLKAFPSAFGAAAGITGGRGGQIYEVTNLNDNGPGSLREALEASGPRIVIIKVEGIISKNEPLNISGSNKGNISIWGQFAPGQGLTVASGRFTFSNSGNIIMRYITAQNGDVNCTVNKDCFGAFGIYRIEPGKGAYIDHCSFRYGADQIFDINSSDSDQIKVTTAYNLVAEGVENHNTGGIFGGGSTAERNAGKYTIARNMWYNISHRFPNLGGKSGSFEVYNNYVVNWGTRLLRFNGPINIDYFNNYADEGNKIKESLVPVNKFSYVESELNGKLPSIFSDNNYIGGWDETPNSDQQNIWVWFKTKNTIVGKTEVIDNNPLDSSLFTQVQQFNFLLPFDGYWPVNGVPQKIQASVGHNRGIKADGSPGFFRDDLDEMYIEKSANGTTDNRYRTSSEWNNSTFAGTPMYNDSDGDHMPDWFENRHPHLDPNDPSDMLATNTNWNFDNFSLVNNAGYSNLEICAEFYAGGFETMLDGTNNLNFSN